jgi:hypothetical protein
MFNENMNDFDLEELEDFEPNEKVTYLVCALGYDEYDVPTDCEVYLKEFKDPAEAITYAKTVDLSTILQHGVEQVHAIASTAYFSLEVETVIGCGDPDDGTENIDTIWETQINIG